MHMTRRSFLETQGGLIVSATGLAKPASSGSVPAKYDDWSAGNLRYLTPINEFKIVGRGNPPPHKLPPEKFKQAGLHPDTWQLEVVPDPESNAQVVNPLSKDGGNAFTWADLMELAKSRAVRFLKLMSCTNGRQPLGMGLYEGVPLRDIIWLTKPKGNVRRVYYYGFHNNDPKQRFQSSLSINRVLEDPPGVPPVILCYKINGQLLTPELGAPARIVVPEAYGNKCVKWIQKIVLTNDYQANDTYALWNNDIDSPMKTCARFTKVPRKVKAKEPIKILGIAQVGMSGLSKVQYCIQPANDKSSEDDPYFSNAPWQDARILPAPDDWSEELPESQGPNHPSQVDPSTGKLRKWPLEYTAAYWAATIDGLAPGKYVLRCRTIDRQGYVQPMPRPFPKSGRNDIQSVPLEVV